MHLAQEVEKLKEDIQQESEKLWSCLLPRVNEAEPADVWPWQELQQHLTLQQTSEHKNVCCFTSPLPTLGKFLLWPTLAKKHKWELFEISLAVLRRYKAIALPSAWNAITSPHPPSISTHLSRIYSEVTFPGYPI